MYITTSSYFSKGTNVAGTTSLTSGTGATDAPAVTSRTRRSRARRRTGLLDLESHQECLVVGIRGDVLEPAAVA